MFAELLFCFGIVGAFMLALVIPYCIFICLMYLVYKADGGKMKLREYFQYW